MTSNAKTGNLGERLEVYTDGECPLCKWMRARVEPFDRNNRLEWLNFRDPAVLSKAAPRTLGELNEEMHVRSPVRGWSRGWDAWVEVLRVLPAWGWLAPLLSIWPSTWLGRIFYRWLARRRYTLFGVPPPCDKGGVCALHTPK